MNPELTSATTVLSELRNRERPVGLALPSMSSAARRGAGGTHARRGLRPQRAAGHMAAVAAISTMLLYGLGALFQWFLFVLGASFLLRYDPLDPLWLASILAMLLGWPLACEAAIAATFLTRRRPRLAAALLFLAAGVLIVPILVPALVVLILVPALATGVLMFLILAPGLVAATAGALAFTSTEADATAERWTGRDGMRALAIGIGGYVLLAPAFGLVFFVTLSVLASSVSD